MAGALAGGCGGEPLTRVELVQRADAACREARHEQDTFEGTNLGDPEYDREYRRNLDRLADRLGELHPPRELEEGYERYLEGVEALEPAFGQLARAVEEGQTRDVDDALLVWIKLRRDAAGASRSLGFTECEALFGEDR